MARKSRAIKSALQSLDIGKPFDLQNPNGIGLQKKKVISRSTSPRNQVPQIEQPRNETPQIEKPRSEEPRIEKTNYEAPRNQVSEIEPSSSSESTPRFYKGDSGTNVSIRIFETPSPT